MAEITIVGFQEIRFMATHPTAGDLYFVKRNSGESEVVIVPEHCHDPRAIERAFAFAMQRREDAARYLDLVEAQENRRLFGEQGA